ncbi:MAG: hypothetical protein KDM64_19365, partial [Verrucomicrobiae bacterium]|nr:hypothetical protein [Verrucomicrobiae bacterium]
MEIETSWSLQPRIGPEQIVELVRRRAKSQTVLVSYEANSRLWGFLETFFGLDPIVIQARQFSSPSSWEQFLNALRLNRQETHHLAIDGTYPPTFPETPCVKCGLTVPAFETICPNCATPRTAEDRPASKDLQKSREVVAHPRDSAIQIGTGETHSFNLRPVWWSNRLSIVTIVTILVTQIPFLLHQYDLFYRQPFTETTDPALFDYPLVLPLLIWAGLIGWLFWTWLVRLLLASGARKITI